MSDQVDPITPPIADPQAVVDAALEPAASVPMNDETPLAFVAPEPSAPVNEPTVIPPATIPPAPEFVAPIPKKKSKILLVVVGIMALLGALGVGGYYAYQSLSPSSNEIAKVSTKKPKDIENKADCDGESNGGWLVWRNGECKVTGISGSPDKDGDGVGDKDTANPNDPVVNATNESACTSSGKGQWCASVDSNGKSYAFCMKNDGTQGNCNNRAVELGYTIQSGIVKCVKDPTNTYYIPDPAMNYNNTVAGVGTIDGVTVYQQVEKQCYDQKMGTGSWLCKEGVKGYSGGVCTGLNGVSITAIPKCFCGTIQVDTGTGHVSYKSACGCDKTEKTTVDSTTTTTDSPTMACTGLTRTPVTAPSVGQAVTFTCSGSVTPSTAGTLSYKYRYSLNSGAYLPMTSNVLTIAACGSYSVQCQACATLNGVLTCDPTWTGATP